MKRLAVSASAFFSMRNRSEPRREAVRAMERMAEEVDSRDLNTHQHSQRVAEYQA